VGNGLLSSARNDGSSVLISEIWYETAMPRRSLPRAPFFFFGAHIGAEMVDAGFSGHINIESGHSPWPEGVLHFAGFLKTL
jgi:hypothetical protein